MGATGSGHGRAGVPRAAAAAAAAPSSAAFGCWRARALARCARAVLALRSRCARAAMHTRRPPVGRSRGQSTTTAAAPPPHLSPLVATVPSSFMPTLARALSLSCALSRSRVIMLSLRSRCAHTRARVSSLRNAALASPHPRSLAPRSRLLPRAVCACFLCAVITRRHVRHRLLRRLCLLLRPVVTYRYVRHFLLHRRHLYQAINPSGLWSALVITAVSSRDDGRALLPGDQPFRALVYLGHHRRL